VFSCTPPDLSQKACDCTVGAGYFCDDVSGTNWRNSMRYISGRSIRGLRRLAGAAACMTVMSALPAGLAAAPAAAASLPSPGRENVVFLYESVSNFTNAQLAAKVAGAQLVVVTPQGSWASEQAAASRIRALGAAPIHYVEYIWRRTGQTIDSGFGIDLDAHPDWRLCYPGTHTPVPATRDRSTGGYYIDMNERAARQAADAYMYKLKTLGYRGFMYDIGRRTFVLGLPHTTLAGSHLYLANLKSGCTGSPVVSGRTVSQGYLTAIDNMSRNQGMYTVLNCCVPSALTNSKVAGAHQVRDISNRFLNEATKAATKSWPEVQTEMAESQASGRVISFQCAETPAKGMYAWARTKMWRVPVALNTGEGAKSGSCRTAVNQWGLWGELSNARLGTPLDSSYKRGQCESGSTYLCLFWRRYTNGIVLVNNGRYTLGSGVQIRLTNSPPQPCGVYVAEVRIGAAPRPITSRCINLTTMSAGQYQGRVFLYRASPWP
jgi:hypothetical protein